MPAAREASRRPLGFAALGVLLTTAALLVPGGRQLGPTVSFVPAMLAVVACFDVLSVYLLVADYRDRGDVRLMMMSWAYVWSLVVMGGYALAFPGAVTVRPPLAHTASVAPYLYVAWHAGFPLLLGAAWLPLPSRWLAPTGPRLRRRLVAVTLPVAVLSGATLVALLAVFVGRLPVLIHGLDTSGMTRLTAPAAIPLVLASLVVAFRGTAHRAGPERWAPIAILACLCDLTLTYLSGHRYSLGWYAGRSLTLIAAGVVLMAMLGEYRRLKARAEHDAAYDSLTGLHNRRAADAALDQMIARSRRSHSPLAVVSFDLDRFKQVNDLYGHEAGDQLLAEVGRLLPAACRLGDLVARVGGEEFLVLLPDTDDGGAGVVAEKIRALVGSLVLPAHGVGVTASLGVTSLRRSDLDAAALLRRVDGALYEAKGSGRDRSVTAAEDAFEGRAGTGNPYQEIPSPDPATHAVF
jgi:diguanylate cyclase (GGDEF)-like protein